MPVVATTAVVAVAGLNVVVYLAHPLYILKSRMLPLTKYVPLPRPISGRDVVLPALVTAVYVVTPVAEPLRNMVYVVPFLTTA